MVVQQRWMQHYTSAFLLLLNQLLYGLNYDEIITGEMTCSQLINQTLLFESVAIQYVSGLLATRLQSGNKQESLRNCVKCL